MTNTRVTEKGQITLPVEARERTTTNPRDPVRVQLVGDAIVLENNRDWVQKTAGIFRKYAKNARPLSADAERQWFEESVAEQVGASLDAESDE
jgi:bifunctional DNA-binding transcriptional regulator/antitoxin component of YhaV-PrlF toxin-antitoxin module